MLEIIEQIKALGLFEVVEVKTTEFDVQFLDFKPSNFSVVGYENIDIIPNDAMNLNTHMLKKKILLTQEISSFDDIFNQFKSIVFNMNTTRMELCLSSETDNNVKVRKLISTLNSASHMIFVNGRCGVGDRVVLSESQIKEITPHIGHIKPVLDNVEYTNQVIVTRETTKDQAGLTFFYNIEENVYEFVELGFFPENNFVVLKLT